MSEPRKHHLNIDGGQVKEDDHVSSYKPISEAETDFRPSKSSLSKSKERVSDEAEEKLLQKEAEAKITTRVDMADAKYVVGDHRNGDAKIELDANKRQFSGLTKEELLKYADDPFWVRLRWCMFALFWALWLCMLAGAVAIIVSAPKCAPPPARTWFEIGPLADMSSERVDYGGIEADLPLLSAAKVQGIFMMPCEDSYEVLETSEDEGCIDQFKRLVVKAKEHSIKVIVDLTANFVSTSHSWFKLSENNSAEYRDYFVWGNGKDFDTDTDRPNPPNNWLSVGGGSAWTYSERRKEHYLHQHGAGLPDLNFSHPAVVARFDSVLGAWVRAGAQGVRLLKSRQLLVNRLLPNEQANPSAAAPPGEYSSLLHKETSDRPELDGLFAHWSHLVAANATDATVFTLAEDGLLGVEWHRLERNSSALRPPSAAPARVAGDMGAVAAAVTKRLGGGRWPAMQLVAASDAPAEAGAELAALALLLPAAPVLAAAQLPPEMNDTTATESFAHLAELRRDASVQHGHFALQAVPARNATDQLLACARWKAGHTGYVAVYNPGGEEARASLAALPALPAALSVHRVSGGVRAYTNYTNNMAVPADDVLVPPYSSVVLSYVPKTAAEE